MAKARTARPQGSTFKFDKVHSCKIHPGIGIARLGNSRKGVFTGPEAPRDPLAITAPNGSFKDADGRIKRQAARFRIYAYDRNGRNLGELPVDGARHRANGRAAKVEWKVHLKNKKGAWYKFFTRWEDPKEVGIRNADIRVDRGKDPDSRPLLVIDPGARCIDCDGKPVKRSGVPESICFDTGSFRETPVTLGELRVDEHGRLLVLGGFGKSGSTKEDNPIGSDSTKSDFWANNDYWYDDISDGPVSATVALPNGKKIAIERPQDTAWVIVAPPKYAPAIYPIVTLYDVMREVAIDQEWIEDYHDVTYFRDIHPLLCRAAETSWVNEEAQRGHGYDKRMDFHNSRGQKPPKNVKRAKAKINTAMLASPALASPDAGDMYRALIFSHIREPLCDDDCDDTDAAEQANTSFMPLLSGDDGDRTEGAPCTWLSVLPSQYRKLTLWKDGKFTSGRKPEFPPLEEIRDPDAQTEALQRAALEPCVGGAFYPGVEVSWTVKNSKLYVEAFRINSRAHGPGDITKYMAVPWQADFYDCKDTWWPAARPDDVIAQNVFDEANAAWRPGQPPLSEALEGRVKWDRGLGVTTLFRRPWQSTSSPEEIDDPDNSERRGCDDMVRYWHELGFVLPRATAWFEKGSKEVEVVQVELERRPHAGMDVRELFHCLLNIEQNRTCLPKVQEFVDNVLKAAQRLQQTPGAFAFMDNIRPFEYEESIFDARMKDIYDDSADFAFTAKVDGVRVKWNPGDKKQNPYFRKRENVIHRIRQLTPFNFLDGAWLRNIHRTGPVDEVNAILFTILKEELGDGVPSQNHANIYRDLCHSFGFYPPPIQSIAFARDPGFLDSAFDSPAFQLAISEFSTQYYPEIIGMSLWLEWTVMDLYRIASIVERVNLSSHFYRMHIAIDNAASGHGAAIIRAVKLYLQQIYTEGGENAVQQHWNRIWDGYVAFAYTFAILIKQVIKTIQSPPSLQARLEQLIRDKASFGRINHGDKLLGDNSISSWFSDPEGFLQALQDNGKIIPGKPDESPFFQLLKFRGGRMYHVFTEDEIQLWRDWTYALAKAHKTAPKEEKYTRRSRSNLENLKSRLTAIHPSFLQAVPDHLLHTCQRAAADHRIALWVEIACADLFAESEQSCLVAELKQSQVQPMIEASRQKKLNYIIAEIKQRYENWLGWSMIRAVTQIAAQNHAAVRGFPYRLIDPRTGKELMCSEWFDCIRRGPNAAGHAWAFLRSLRDLCKQQQSLFDELFAPTAQMYFAFDCGISGNDGCRALDTMEAWCDAGYPLPPEPKGLVRPLRLDSSLDEEESHSTGVVMGFGTVH